LLSETQFQISGEINPLQITCCAVAMCAAYANLKKLP
jgi:hypothetical protein